MKHIKLLIATLACSSISWAADLNNITPGQLEGMIADGSVGSATTLTLKGKIDARDFAALENLPATVTALDLSEVSVERLTLSTRKYFGRTLFAEGELPGYSFFKSGLVSVKLPLNTKAIGDGAFAASATKSIVIPEGVESIGDYAFYSSDLREITLPSTLKSIGKGAFANCRELQSISFAGTKLTEIPEKAFSGALALKDIMLPANLKKVDREAFSHTRIEKLNLQNVEEFGPYALSGMTALSQLAINPNAVIDDGLLMDDISLESLGGLPSDVPAYFAANCTALDINKLIDGTNTVGDYAFANNATETVIVGAGLSELRQGVFAGMTGLKFINVITLDTNVPDVDDTTFEGIEQGEIYLITSDSGYQAFKDDPVWGRFRVKSDSEYTTSVEDVAADNNLEIKLTPAGLDVHSPSGIADVWIFTADGRLAFSASGNGENLTVNSDLLPSGVLIVKASAVDGSSKSVTILNK